MGFHMSISIRSWRAFWSSYPVALIRRNSRELRKLDPFRSDHDAATLLPPHTIHIMQSTTRRGSSSRLLLLCFMCGSLLIPKPRILFHACIYHLLKRCTEGVRNVFTCDYLDIFEPDASYLDIHASWLLVLRSTIL